MAAATKRDLRRDLHLSFEKIFKSREEMVRQLQSLEQCQTVRNDLQWALNLRFLRVPSDPESWTSLTLTETSEFPKERRYVAVSYCWPTEVNKVQDHITICSKNGERPNRAPTNILRRAIKFAAAQGIPFVWIDQECIDQDDEVQKQLGIQAMDAVYQNCKIAIGLIDPCLNSQEEWAVSDRIRVSMSNTYQNSSDAFSLINACQKICTDRWFQRCWTYQEMFCAARQLRLLIPCHPDTSPVSVTIRNAPPDSMPRQSASRNLTDSGASVYPASKVEHMPVEIECTLSSLQFLMREADMWTNEFQKDDGEMAFVPVPTIKALDDMVSYAQLQAMESIPRLLPPAGAFEQMEQRGITIESDRLAILANLCGFDERLDTNALLCANCGFSVALLSLFIMNGIFPAYWHWGDFELQKLVDGQVSLGDQQSQAKLIQPIGLAPMSAKIRDIIAFSSLGSLHVGRSVFGPAISPQLLVESDGVRTSGWLWSIDRCLQLGHLKSKLPRWYTKDSADREDREIVYNVLLHCLNTKLARLFEAIWRHIASTEVYREWSPSRIREVHSSQQACFSQQACSLKRQAFYKAKMREQVDECLKFESQAGRQFFNTSRMLARYVAKHGLLPYGTLPGESEPSAVFLTHVGAAVIVNCGMPHGESTYPNNGTNHLNIFEVAQDTDLSSQSTNLFIRGRTCGMWSADKSLLRSFLFPWDTTSDADLAQVLRNQTNVQKVAQDLDGKKRNWPHHLPRRARWKWGVQE